MIKTCKFGGSSVADSKQIQKVEAIIRADHSRRYIIVSAPGKRNSEDHKITDLLYLAHETAHNKLDLEPVMNPIRERYEEICWELGLRIDLDEIFQEIAEGMEVENSDYAVSRGEYLFGFVFSKYINAEFIDPAKYIFFDEDGLLDEARTYPALSKRLEGEGTFIIPGFYGTDIHGKIKTFSRGGSDITGSIVAHAVGSDLYENWTDVSGLRMVDPGIVDDPAHMPEVTYQELRELAYMGANVLHDEAIIPVRKLNIPIVIKNTNEPEHAGTKIVGKRDASIGGPVVGIAGKKNFEAIYIMKTLLNKTIGFGRRFLSIFENHGVSFEHMPSGIDSMSVIVHKDELEGHRNSIISDIKNNLKVDSVENYKNLALVAIVGNGMAYHCGIAANLFTALAKENINIRLIDQGASELSIIIGVDNNDFEKTIQSLYTAFSSSIN